MKSEQMRDTFSSYLNPSVRGEQDDQSRTGKTGRLEVENPSACGERAQVCSTELPLLRHFSYSVLPLEVVRVVPWFVSSRETAYLTGE